VQLFVDSEAGVVGLTVRVFPPKKSGYQAVGANPFEEELVDDDSHYVQLQKDGMSKARSQEVDLAVS
jgi:hypothetical protein